MSSKVCAVCKVHAGPGVAFDTDHIIALTDGGTIDSSNEQIICVRCHRDKTGKENSVRTETTTDFAMGKIKGALSRKSEHQYRSYTVQSLVYSVQMGEIVNADANRDAVWTESKQSEYVSSVLYGTSCNSFWFNRIQTSPDDTRMDVYDGNNRLTALVSFMEGRLHLHVPKGRTIMNVSYSKECNVKGCKGCITMLERDRQRFGMRNLDAFVWDGLSSEEACERAKKINEGTPMVPGERLKMILGKRNTPRTQLLLTIYHSCEFKKVYEKDVRSQGLLFLGRVVYSLDKDIRVPMLLKPRCQSVQANVVENWFDQQASLKQEQNLLLEKIKLILCEIFCNITEDDVKKRGNQLNYMRIVIQMAVVLDYDVAKVINTFRNRLDDKEAGELRDEDEINAIVESGNKKRKFGAL